MATATVKKETIEKIKAELPDILKQSPIYSITAIAAKLGMTRQHLWNAGKKSKTIKKMLDEYQAEKKPSVEDLVKNTWFHRLASGKAHATEYIFFMMNHFPDEYQDKRALVNNNVTNNLINNEQNHVLIADKYLRSLPEKDLDDLISGLGKRKQDQSAKSRV